MSDLLRRRSVRMGTHRRFDGLEFLLRYLLCHRASMVHANLYAQLNQRYAQVTRVMRNYYFCMNADFCVYWVLRAIIVVMRRIAPGPRQGRGFRSVAEPGITAEAGARDSLSTSRADGHRGGSSTGSIGTAAGAAMLFRGRGDPPAVPVRADERRPRQSRQRTGRCPSGTPLEFYSTPDPRQGLPSRSPAGCGPFAGQFAHSKNRLPLGSTRAPYASLGG
jgi:hypothetical protein